MPDLLQALWVECISLHLFFCSLVIIAVPLRHLPFGCELLLDICICPGAQQVHVSLQKLGHLPDEADVAALFAATCKQAAL